jgi:serine O-acetyltransferase
VVIHDVPPNSTVVGNPGHPVRIEGRRPEGPDADWIHLPDPVADAIKGLSSRIAALESEAAEGNGQSGGDVRRLRSASNGGSEPDGRANPSLGPNPAGG